MDELVSAVRELMDEWGTAGRDMYWRPQLSVTVTPGGEVRYAELRTLLQGSGLTIIRK